MRDEIRLGNEALAQNDMETAKQPFQHLLDHGGTPMQEQSAGNRLPGDAGHARRAAPSSATGAATQASYRGWWHNTSQARAVEHRSMPGVARESMDPARSVHQALSHS
jgi:hypothetical protein